MDFVVACVVAHDAMLEFGGTVLKRNCPQYERPHRADLWRSSSSGTMTKACTSDASIEVGPREEQEHDYCRAYER